MDELARLRDRLAGLRVLLVALPPFRRDAGGQVWLDPLWHRDLAAHLDYLGDLTVLAPRAPMPEGGTGDLLPLAAPGLRFLGMPQAASTRGALRALPAMMRAARAAVAGADVVQAGVAGWPVPPGLIVNPLAAWAGKPLVVVVESAFWRLSGPGPHGAAARARARATEAFARWSARRAALAVFTQREYLGSIGGGPGPGRLLTPASLIEEGDVLTAAEAEAAWDAKGARPRLLLAARLEPTKGVGVLLEALRLARGRGVALDVTVMGEGSIAGEVRTLAAGGGGLAWAPPVPYGPGFLATLRGFHAVLAPSLTDEQPRILLDAASQGVPALASDTAGHRDLVAGPGAPGGWLVPPGDAPALLAAMRAVGPGEARTRGMAALARAGGRTRTAMHLARARALAEALGR